MVRIISGNYKGLKLTSPKELPVRPTTDRAKEGIFNILDNRYHINKKKILDLFSGTGNIAYEFASRGCKDITVVDNNTDCINFIKNTSLKLMTEIKTLQQDSIEYLHKCKEEFDIIFIDPPYNYLSYKEILKIIIEKKIIKKDGCIIIEHNCKTILDGDNIEKRKYGQVCFSIFSF